MSHIWKVVTMDYLVQKDGLDNVVTIIHWTCSGADEHGNTGSVYGTHSLPAPDPNNFTPWADLDEATVLTWMKNDMIAKAEPGENPPLDIETRVDEQIAEKANPSEGSGTPW